MDRNGTKKLLEILKMSYPSSYKSMTSEEASRTVDLYAEMFAEYEEIIVAQALKNYVRANQYPPTIAGIIEQINMLSSELTPVDLWNELHKAVRNCGYRVREAYAELPDPVRRWVGSPGSLREIAFCDSAIVATVIRGEFLKSIGDVIKSEQARRGLSGEVRRAIEESRVKMLEDET